MIANLLVQRLRRYKGLVALISLLILFIIAVVLLRTYVDTVLVQRETFARVKTLNYVEMLDRFGTEDTELMKEINQFLLMFRDGGRLATLYGPAWDYPAVRTPALADSVRAAIDAYERGDLPDFHEKFKIFDSVYGRQVQGRQTIVIRAQYVSAGIMFVGFLGVLGLLFFRLGKADDIAAAVRRENEHILASTKEGVFLIDSNYQIGAQRSKAVDDLFGQKIDVSGNFIDLIKRFVKKEDLERTEKFLKLVFGGRVKPKLMGDLNPLQNIELEIEKRVGGSFTRVLNFDFSRDEQSDKVTELLVTVSDVTNETVLREELETIQGVQEQRLNLLKGLLHVEPPVLKEFFKKGQKAYTQINNFLEEGESGEDANIEKLEKIGRIIHRLKGDAAALRLDLFSSSAHHFEDTIDGLRKQNLVDGQSLLKLVVQLKNMIAELDLASSMVNQFGGQASEARVVDDSQVVSLDMGAEQEFTQKLSDLAAAVAQREAKLINFSVSGAHHLGEYPDIAPELYDIAVQLVRNAVVHGIEEPKVRNGLHKPEFGKLEVAFALRGNELSMTVADDGQGLQFDQIKRKAVEAGFLTAEAAEQADERSLLKTVFAHGFSSRDEVNEDAGRGVGLDAVKELLDEIGGRITVGTSPGKYARFVIKVNT